MLLLVAFAFIAGLVTVLSPCILPLLPIILSSADGSKQKPLGVVVGFVISFTFFTLFLSTIVRLLGLPADNLRLFSIIVLIGFGSTLLVPAFQAKIEILFSRLAGLMPTVKGQPNFLGGVLVGVSLGLLWTPCVGPILASVISLSITGEVTAQSAIITFTYALGTAIPMLMIMMAGSTALQRVPWLVRNTGKIQKAFGLLMILTAVGIFFNVDRRFQSWVLTTFPNYGVGLTKFEENEQVQEELGRINRRPVDETMIGKTTSEVGPKGPVAPELQPSGEWLNSEPLTIQGLKGRVILVDFWTYTCINCQRTFPYLKNWWEKYRDDGLVIIGVHAPEFEFEKNLANLQQAVQDFQLTYPIVQDNEFKTWRAYDNHYWPAKYLIDRNGYIRFKHFGEGQYDETEFMIQQLLEETGVQVDEEINNPEFQVFTRTPELYLGYLRQQFLASPEKVVRDQYEEYSIPLNLPSDYYGFSGQWLISEEFASPQAGSTLELNFEAKEVYLVMKSKNGTRGKLTVQLDGKLENLGEDVNASGELEVESNRLYKLIRLPSLNQHRLKLEFLDSNVELYAFTFG